MSYLFFVFGLLSWIAAGVFFSLGHYAWQGLVMVFIGILYFFSGLDGLDKE